MPSPADPCTQRPGLLHLLHEIVGLGRLLVLLTLTFILLPTDQPPAIQYLSSLLRVRVCFLSDLLFLPVRNEEMRQLNLLDLFIHLCIHTYSNRPILGPARKSSIRLSIHPPAHPPSLIKDFCSGL